MGTTETPLYDALAAAIKAYDLSEEWDADELPEIAAMFAALPDDAAPDAVSETDRAAWQVYRDAWRAAWSAHRKPLEAAVEAAREALFLSSEPRKYEIRWLEGSGVRETVISTPEAIEQEVTDRSETGDYGDDGTVTYVDVAWSCIDGTDAQTTITVDVPEPDCDHDDGHDWRSPYSVLGGCKENPGVWGKGGGVICTEVCAHCGTYRVTDTWAQRPDTGEQGLTEVTYRDADDDSLAYVERKRGKALESALDDLYEIKRRDDGDYTTTIDHDGHAGSCDDCEECKKEIESIRSALPVGWGVYWTGDGNGTESDVAIEWQK